MDVGNLPVKLRFKLRVAGAVLRSKPVLPGIVQDRSLRRHEVDG